DPVRGGQRSDSIEQVWWDRMAWIILTQALASGRSDIFFPQAEIELQREAQPPATKKVATYHIRQPMITQIHTRGTNQDDKQQGKTQPSLLPSGGFFPQEHSQCEQPAPKTH